MHPGHDGRPDVPPVFAANSLTISVVTQKMQRRPSPFDREHNNLMDRMTSGLLVRVAKWKAQRTKMPDLRSERRHVARLHLAAIDAV
jgi:hypothetical protein